MGSPWPYRQMTAQPRLPFPGQRGIASPIQTTRGFTSAPDVSSLQSLNLERASKEEIAQRLSTLASFNPEIWEEYIVKNTRSENISRWLTKRLAKERNSGELTKGDRTSHNADKEESKLIKKVECGDHLRPLYSLAAVLCESIHSSGFNLYGIGGIGKTLTLYNPEIPQWDPSQTPQRSFLIAKNTTVSGHVALTREPICVEDVHMDPRFPKRIGADDSSAHGISVLCFPIILPNEDLIGVLEFYRSWHEGGYTAKDQSSVQDVLDWATLAIEKSSICTSLKQQTDMNDFLLDVSRTYLDDITDIDNIIEHIMRFAKTLVSADRCCLFLYDEFSKELYSDLFDNGVEVDGKAVFEKKNEIRFHVSKGIAGYVATSRTVVNIPDAYADPRFNRDVDKVTGYTTNNILCLPIMSENEVYGVVEMINKKTGGSFTKLDEDNFKMFAIFCALALRYSKIHARLEREHNRHEVVTEQFLLSMKASEKEAQALAKQIVEGSLAEVPMEFDRFQFSVLPYESELPGFFVHMLKDVCMSEYEIPASELARFTLTVRNNYHDQPYHNWKHAVTVAHSMYCIMKRHADCFSQLEAFALIVACLGHDIDHRAFSNQFLQKTHHPLATLYPTSTMEQHHYAMLVMILEQAGHQIFAQLDDASYRFVLGLMKHAILATDLAVFFGNQRRLQELVAEGEFEITDTEHRKVLIGIMMTACDLSSTAKKWEPTKTTVYELYEEFWAEGDLRKEKELSFVPMMDRDLVDEVPDGQVGFYTNVSVRCYETLVSVLPECEELLVVSNENLARWRQESEKKKLEKERHKKAEQEAPEDKEELGVMLRGGMWVIEKSRLEDQQE